MVRREEAASWDTAGRYLFAPVSHAVAVSGKAVSDALAVNGGKGLFSGKR